MNPGFEELYRVPGLNATSWYGIIATSCSHVVGSNGSHGRPFVQGHVPFCSPDAWDSSICTVTESIDPHASCTLRSSGMYPVTRASSDRRARPPRCRTGMGRGGFVVEPPG